MNSSEKIQRNETVTFFPKFEGASVYREHSMLVIEQEDKKIFIPISMVDSLFFAINKARGTQ